MYSRSQTNTRTEATLSFGNTTDGRGTLYSLQYVLSIICYLSHNYLYTKDGGVVVHTQVISHWLYTSVKFTSLHIRVSMAMAHYLDLATLNYVVQCFSRLIWPGSKQWTRRYPCILLLRISSPTVEPRQIGPTDNRTPWITIPGFSGTAPM